MPDGAQIFLRLLLFLSNLPFPPPSVGVVRSSRNDQDVHLSRREIERRLPLWSLVKGPLIIRSKAVA
jgi:hypothetical protein